MCLSAAPAHPDGSPDGIILYMQPQTLSLGQRDIFNISLPFVSCASCVCVSLSLSGSREAAFVYAISSAGVVYALTRACSQGELKTCNCDPHKRGRSSDDRGEFDWGGCSDNINYGIKFAKAFIDAKERTVRDARALMNLHNNRCGRTVSVRLLALI